jgi:DNA ligase (NAD+)
MTEFNFFGMPVEKSREQFTSISLNQLEELYEEACDAYYDEAKAPIMPDIIFDIVEEILRAEGSRIVDEVNGPRNTKDLIHPHPTAMLSLDKVQVKDAATILIDFFLNWLKDYFGIEIEFTPKFDGNAINLVYERGKLKQAITRGKHGKGKDVTDKLRLIVPATIPYKDELVEIRGEVVIPLTIFESEYFDIDDPNCPANPRNFIAGILNRDIIEKEIIKDFAFVAYVIIAENISNIPLKDNNTLETLQTWGFNNKFPIFRKTITDISSIVDIYEEFVEYRRTSIFQLDGIVAKVPEQYREAMGVTSHHPRWAKAIKFPAKDAVTKISNITNTMGSKGELSPKAILMPVELDGTMVSKASLHNYRYVRDKKLNIGATVKIRKAGDIIPQIIEIIEASETEFIFPTEYKGHKTYWDGPHIRVENYQDLPDFAVRKIDKGLKILDVKGIGPATIENLHGAGIKTIHSYFDGTMTKESLITSGLFKAGRALDKIFESLQKLKKVELWRVINAVQIDGIGKTISAEFAKYLTGQEYSFAGYEKALMAEAVKENSEIQEKIVYMLETLEKVGVEVIKPKQKVAMSTDTITFEMTGEAPSGFKSRGEFAKLIEPKGYMHTALKKDTKLLICDDLKATTSKMKTATKLGIPIKTYDQILEELGIQI